MATATLSNLERSWVRMEDQVLGVGLNIQTTTFLVLSPGDFLLGCPTAPEVQQSQAPAPPPSDQQGLPDDPGITQADNSAFNGTYMGPVTMTASQDGKTRTGKCTLKVKFDHTQPQHEIQGGFSCETKFEGAWEGSFEANPNIPQMPSFDYTGAFRIGLIR